MEIAEANHRARGDETTASAKSGRGDPERFFGDGTKTTILDAKLLDVPR